MFLSMAKTILEGQNGQLGHFEKGGLTTTRDYDFYDSVGNAVVGAYFFINNLN